MYARTLATVACAMMLASSSGCSTVSETLVKWGLKKTEFEGMGAHSAPQMANTTGPDGTLNGVPASVTNPSLLADHLRRGQAAESQGKPAEARLHYDRVLQLQANNPIAHHRLAVLADQERQYIAAEKHYLAALNGDSRNPDLLSDLGYSYFLQGRYRDSELYMKQALQMQPGHQTAINNLGLLYAKRGMYDDAKSLFAQQLGGPQADRKMAELFPKGRPELPGGGDPTQLANQPSDATMQIKRMMDQEKEKVRLARQREKALERLRVEQRGLQNLPGNPGPYQPGPVGAPDPRMHSVGYPNPGMNDGNRLKQQLSQIDQSYQIQEQRRQMELQRQKMLQRQMHSGTPEHIAADRPQEAIHYPTHNGGNQTMPASHLQYSEQQTLQHQHSQQPQKHNPAQRPSVDPRQNMSVWPDGNSQTDIAPTHHQQISGQGTVEQSYHQQPAGNPGQQHPGYHQHAVGTPDQTQVHQPQDTSSATLVGMNAGSGMPMPMVSPQPQPKRRGDELRMQRRDHLYSHRPTEAVGGQETNQHVQEIHQHGQPVAPPAQDYQPVQYDRMQSPQQHRQSQFRQRFQQPPATQPQQGIPGQGRGVIHPTSYQPSPVQQQYGQQQSYDPGPVITPANGQDQFRRHYP